MQLPHRRQFLQLAAGAAPLIVATRIASAPSYPTRPVRVIVPFVAAGGADIVARVIGPSLSQRLGQPIVVENRPGAGGNIGTEAVVRAAADGHTLLLVTGANAWNATLYDNLNFNFIRDIAPVATIARAAFVMEVIPSLPVRTVPEFIAYANAYRGKVNMASGGIGSPQHFTGELFQMMTGIDMLHVPYRGTAPALNGLFAGEVQVMFDTVSTSIEHIRAGKLRALAVTSTVRSDLMPDVPTVGDFVPGYEATGWLGLGAPKNTPADIVDQLNREISTMLADVTLKGRLAALGYTAFAISPADFGELIAADTEKWAKVIKFANIKPE
jgi:tripartite-type tricarboxylate transporter receptor subunit TctC